MTEQKKKNYRYSCPFCGAVYQHDDAYIHSVAQCQKKEREGKK